MGGNETDISSPDAGLRISTVAAVSVGSPVVPGPGGRKPESFTWILILRFAGSFGSFLIAIDLPAAAAVILTTRQQLKCDSEMWSVPFWTKLRSPSGDLPANGQPRGARAASAWIAT